MSSSPGESAVQFPGPDTGQPAPAPPAGRRGTQLHRQRGSSQPGEQGQGQGQEQEQGKEQGQAQGQDQGQGKGSQESGVRSQLTAKYCTDNTALDSTTRD